MARDLIKSESVYTSNEKYRIIVCSVKQEFFLHVNGEEISEVGFSTAIMAKNEEWVNEFISYMCNKYKTEKDHAMSECESYIECNEKDLGDWEDAVNECAEAWSE